jgi:predicted transcriptional regulator
VLQNKAKTLQPLIAIDATATVQAALDLFKQNDVSQIPVFEKGKPVGTVMDNALLTAVLGDNSRLGEPVKAHMEPAFPVIGTSSPIEHAIDLLKKKDSAVLIEEDQKIIGILTRFDVIEYMAR